LLSKEYEDRDDKVVLTKFQAAGRRRGRRGRTEKQVKLRSGRGGWG